MISDMSIGGVGSNKSDLSTHINRVTEAAVKTSDSIPQASSKSVATDLNTTKELDIAELQGKKIAVGEEVLIKAIEKANKALQGISTTFEFRIHEATKQIMVKVLDKDTGEVVREIPPEKILDLVAKLWEKAGLIVDERG